MIHDKKLYEKFQSSNPQLIKVDEFDCYLAKYVYGTIFIDKDDIASANEKLNLAAQNGEIEGLEGFSHEKFEDWFTQDYMELIYDNGNIVDIEQGGDIWAFYLLQPIIDSIKADAKFIMYDDENKFWVVDIVNSKMNYYRQK